MKVIITKQYETSDGTKFNTRHKALMYETREQRWAEEEKKKWLVYQTPTGKWSIRCQNCGKRHLQLFADDCIWCKQCQNNCCYHEPDEDDSTICFLCGFLFNKE